MVENLSYKQIIELLNIDNTINNNDIEFTLNESKYILFRKN